MKKGSIVQIINNNHDWYGCVIFVTEVKKWGIQGFLYMPINKCAYIRLNYEDIDYVGESKVEIE